jgi:tetratricopeptide (TPR) repeat protein
MEQQLRDLLRQNYDYLVDELVPPYFMNTLYAEKILCEQDMEELNDVKLKGMRRKQATRFLDIMMKKSEESIYTFLEVLRSQKGKQPHIYEKLYPRKSESGVLNRRTPQKASRDFVGREREVRDILERLSSDSFIGIVGPAGIGKSELARRVCKLYLECGDKKTKHLSVTLGTTVKTFSAVDLYCYILRPFVHNMELFSEFRSQGEEILDRMEQFFELGDCVLVIDSCENCETPELNKAIHSLIKKLILTSCKVIATSQRTFRSLLPSGSDPNYLLSPLQKKDAVDLVTVNSSFQSVPVQNDSELMNSLAHHCGYYPLALVIVRSLLQQGSDPRELLECFEDSVTSKFKVLSPNFEQANIGELQPLREAMQTCFDHLKSRNRTAYDIMLILSVIPQAFDKAAKDEICSSLNLLTSKAVRFNALQPVKEHCFLQSSTLLDKSSGYEMHSLIREFASEVRRESKLDEKAKSSFINHFATRLRQIGSGYLGNSVESFQSFGCHMESFSLLLSSLVDKDWESVVRMPEVTQCIYNTFVSPSVGRLFIYRIPHKQHIKALEALLRLIRIPTNRALVEEAAEARILLDLGKVLKVTWDGQNMKRALDCFEQAMKLLSVSANCDITTRFTQADCFKARATVRSRMAGRKEGASRQRQQALEELGQSTKLFEGILEEIESRKLSSNLNEKDIMRKLASCTKELAETRQWLDGPVAACQLFKKSLQYRLNADGEDHVPTAKVLLSLGKCYRLQSKPKNTLCKAERLILLEKSDVSLKRALNITSKCCIERGPIAGKIHYQLGLVYKEMSRLNYSSRSEYENFAIDSFETGIAILTKFGPRHDLGLLYYNLGRARSDQGDFEAAEKAYELAENTYVVAGGEFGSLYRNWAETYQKQGKHETELTFLQKSIEYLSDDFRRDQVEKRIDELSALLRDRVYNA